MSNKRVLSVGQCNADHASITGALRQHFDAEVVRAHGAEEALTKLRAGQYDLVLVNRVFDSDGESGHDLIRQLKEEAAATIPPVMLVSNHDDAQEEAIAAGALPGFGKAALNQPQTLERLKNVLGSERTN